jgi:hypothetical protein
MALRDILQASNRRKDLDSDAIKEEVHNHLEQYRELIAY